MQRPKVSLLLLLFFLPLGLVAQGWEKAFGGQQSDGFYDVLNTADGGFLSVGHKQTQTNPSNFSLYLVKTDGGGFPDWSHLISDTTYSYFGKSIQPAPDGGYIIGGTAITENIPRGFLTKINSLGQLEWTMLSMQDSVYGRNALALPDGTYMLTGSAVRMTANGLDYDFFQTRVDATGTTILQEQQYGGPLFDDCRDAIMTPNGDILLAGFTNSQGAGHYDVLLLKINIAGDSLWARTHGASNAELAFAIAPTSDGNYVLVGQSESLAMGSQDVFLTKINQNAEVLWWKTFPKPGIELPSDVSQTSVGGYIITGYTQANADADRQAFLMKTYSNGDEHWRRHFGGINHDGGIAVQEAGIFGYVMAGYTNSYGSGASDGYLVRTDNSGIANSCFVAGNVRSNFNTDCVPETFGGYVENLIVEVAGTATYFGTTDADGNYAVPVQAGSYNVRLVIPSPLWGLCEDSVQVAVSGSFDTAWVDFSLVPDTLCPYMQVDLSTLTMRRCFQNAYTVSYCNTGTVAADPAEVVVTFDPYLIVDSTSIPWTAQAGNTFTFDVGHLDPFECGSFLVYYTVDCDSTTLGQTHCSEAHIFPDQLCMAVDPQWDEASIQLSASCNGDSIIFLIQNVGAGDMTTPQGFIIIEDHIVGLQGDFILNSGQDTTISLPANGATWRMEAAQSPGHPGNSKPSIAVEGCGGTNFSTGFVIQYPLNDADPFVDTDCRENIGSYDPNDKTGFPLGYGNRHFIEQNTDIEYLIRFQNTGTDTAFTVVIRDTLSPYLDPTTLVVGGSSHPMRHELYGNGILKFVFDEIMLPDSNVNEPASHGFVKFRISQKRDVSLGLVIQNRAAIYFDFNEPIITNTTFHTIAKDFIEIDVVGNSSNFPSESLPWVHVFPNPFVGEAMFELKNISGNQFDFQLLNAQGKVVGGSSFRGDQFQFKRNDLPDGVYFFQIKEKGRMVATGKIVLH